MAVRIKRVYDDPSADDGFRVLVDRIWPRGITKERAKADLWLKEVAPSTQLRRWWNHDQKQADEFTRRYRAELAEDTVTNAALARLQEHIAQNERSGTNTTLVYSAKDPELNQARALDDYLADPRSQVSAARRDDDPTAPRSPS